MHKHFVKKLAPSKYLLLAALSICSSQTFALSAPVIESAEISGCNGKWLMDWSSVSGATSYQIWSQAGTSSYALYATTTSSLKIVTASTSAPTTNFKVKACDGAGCGAFSNVWSVYYYSGCP